MSEQFSLKMNRFFGANEGAYSKVTRDEFDHSQVTFTGHEQALAERFFGAELDRRHGSRAAILKLGLDPTLPYRLYPSGDEIRLTTSYKTNRPNELRYYLRRDLFKPDPGNYWGIFRKGRHLWICEFSPRLLKQIENGVYESKQRNEVLDPDEGVYQDEANNPPAKKRTVVDKWGRSPLISNAALVQAKFVCELESRWPTFKNRLTGLPHMEAHHLIPMSLQGQFAATLDLVENVCCLNPLAHRMLHHAAFSDIEGKLVSLLKKRPKLLIKFGLLERDVLAMYDR